jgi:hypothetical protein
METIVGFVIGYLVGSRQSREGFDHIRSAIRDISTSDEVREGLATGIAIAIPLVQRALRGSVGEIANALPKTHSRAA